MVKAAREKAIEGMAAALLSGSSHPMSLEEIESLIGQYKAGAEQGVGQSSQQWERALRHVRGLVEQLGLVAVSDEAVRAVPLSPAIIGAEVHKTLGADICRSSAGRAESSRAPVPGAEDVSRRRRCLDGYVPSKAFCVYVITCDVNGKRYVGKAANAWNRWCAHRRHAWSRKTPGCSALYSAIRKHGLSQFSIEILSEHDTEAEAFAAESAAIANLRTRSPRGYNLTDGGEGAAGAKRTPIEAHANRLRMRALWAEGAIRIAQRRGRMEGIWANGNCVGWVDGAIPTADNGSASCPSTRAHLRHAFTMTEWLTVRRVVVAILSRRWDARVATIARNHARRGMTRVQSAKTRDALATANLSRQLACAVRDAAIVRDYRAGMTTHQCAAVHGAQRRQVLKVLLRAGVDLRPTVIGRPRRLRAA